MGRFVDLDAARAEATAEPVEVVLKGERFTLVPELPIDFVFYLAQGNLRAGARLLFPDDADADFERFIATNPTVNDIKRISDAYSTMTPGES